jgi:p-cumate 2,3-dioxygenase subunit beta
MNKSVEMRLAIEDFVYREADLLDRWKLDEWVALWDDECTYEVTTTGDHDPETTSPDNSLYLIADNRFRLEQRVVRLNKTSAHVEYPHSKTRHLFTNVVVREDSANEVSAQVNFAVFRTKRGVTNHYMGYSLYTFAKLPDGCFKIKRKRSILDLEGLVPQGKLSILL